MNGSQVLVAMLKAYGVKHIFGVPGDTGVPFYDALYDARDEITHILARDERSAGFMADCYARLTGKPGVCEGPSGGGATYMVPGVTEGNFTSVPMIALTSDNPLSYEEKGALTALDQGALFKPVTKWNTMVKSADMLPHLVRRAFRMATTGRPGAVHLTLPKNVLSEPFQNGDIYAEEECMRAPAYRVQADSADVARAAQLLLAARKPVIIAGGGVMLSQAWTELTEFAEMLGVPVATTINGKGSISELHTLSIGVIGGNGGRDYANELVREADLVFFIGTRANYVDTANWTVPSRRTPPTIIQLDIDGAEIGNNYPIAAGLCGDARATLQALRRELLASGQRPANTWDQDELARAGFHWWDDVMAKAQSDEVPLRPQRVFHELQEVLPRDAILVADPGTPTPYLAAQYRLLQPGRHTLIPRAHGGLGWAIPGVIGAKAARPDAPVVGLTGDGSLAMAAGELSAVAQFGKPVTIILFNNGGYGWIKILQKLDYSERYFGVDFQTGIDYVRVAEGFGLRGVRVEQPEQIGPALREALASNRSTLIDVLTPCEGDECPPVNTWLEQERKRQQSGQGQ